MAAKASGWGGSYQPQPPQAATTSPYPSGWAIHTEGTLVANGLEQQLVLVENTGPFAIKGFVDLSGLRFGEKVTIRQYFKIKTGKGYIRYNSEDYIGVLEDPLLVIKKQIAAKGVRVTLQQRRGELRSFDHLWLTER